MGPRRWVGIAVVVGALALAVTASTTASANTKAASPWAGDQTGVQHLHFKYGPIDVKPGQNNIALSDLQVPKPAVDGYILGIAPNIQLPQRQGSAGRMSCTCTTASG